MIFLNDKNECAVGLS